MGAFVDMVFLIVPSAGMAGGCVPFPANADTSFTHNLGVGPPDVAFSGGYRLETTTHNSVSFPLKRVPAVRFAQEEPEDADLTAAAGPTEIKDATSFSKEEIEAREALLQHHAKRETLRLLVPGRAGIEAITSLLVGDDMLCKYVALEITDNSGRKRIEVVLADNNFWHHGIAKAVQLAENGEGTVKVVAAGLMGVPYWEDGLIFRNGKSLAYQTESRSILPCMDSHATDPLEPAKVAGMTIMDNILREYFPEYRLGQFPG